MLKAGTGISSALLQLKSVLGNDRIRTDDLNRTAHAADASCYRKMPEAVIFPGSEEDVIHILKILNTHEVPLCFRGAGTSLSGQALSDSILIKLEGAYWERTEIGPGAKSVKVRIAKTGGKLNALLKPHGVKFGPDPASVNSATIGGIIANNASGMSCGTHANSYATIESARIVLANGSLLDSSDAQSRRDFASENRELISTIEALKKEIESRPDLVQKIRKKYSIKNTIGYSLNSFLDFEDPIDIIMHLMIGSEGTLGFVSEAVFRTLEHLEHRASSMIYFRNLEDACRMIPALKKLGAAAIELLDREALRAVEGKEGIPDYIGDFDDRITALLIDLEASGPEELKDKISSLDSFLSDFQLARDAEFTTNPKEILGLWKIRKGVFPSVGGMRNPGTTVIIEDIAVAEEHIAPAVKDLRELLDEEGYRDAVIYGHAIDGNLHFIFAQDFEDPLEIKRYGNLISKLCRLIIEKYDGSLKAEHGTGLNMAPFVEYEWGSALYGIMTALKKAFDPNNILNPGVVINSDSKVHLKNFKSAGEVDELVDKCIECGFCEISCLSSGFTLSARQRIVVQREIHRLAKLGEGKAKIKRLESGFRYAGDMTCASDGLCSTTCPLDIDTGKYIKKLREEKRKKEKLSGAIATATAKHMPLVHRSLKGVLGFVNAVHRVLGSKTMSWISGGLRRASFGKIPLWNRHMPLPVGRTRETAGTTASSGKKVVYFTSCINQTMGPSHGPAPVIPLHQAMSSVLSRAGYSVIHPDNMKNLCCGMPWESKGFTDIADSKLAELEAALLQASENGKYPVLCDNSPCLYRMKEYMSTKMKLYEPVEFTHDFLLNSLDITPVNEKYAFHITCSSLKMGLEDKFRKVAEACTSNAVFPENTACCGFAGDKGFTLPELNAYALRNLKPEISSCKSGYSNSRTCEIGLSQNGGIDYQSIIYLVDELTNSSKQQ